jgi:multiple sugar transport system permease protein/putative aldouronate transport system permease protein
MRTVATARGDRLYYFINNTILVLFTAIVLYPLVYILSSSLSSAQAVIAGEVWLFPVDLTFEGYTGIFEHPGILRGYANSIFYTVAGTSINIVITLLAAYPLSRKDFYGRKIAMILVTITMLFNAGLIPTYLVVRGVGILNTRWAMLLPTAMAAWNVIIARTFFQATLPDELLEASKIDGSSDYRFVWSVALPLSTPLIAVLALFYAVMHWNAYFNALIYLSDPKLYPLQIILREILIVNSSSLESSISMDMDELLRRQNLLQLLKYSLIVVASVPVLLIYPFVQKHFVVGIMIGSLKG